MHTGKGGVLNQREGERGNRGEYRSQSWVENTNMTESTQEISYLQSMNSNKHLPQSPYFSYAAPYLSHAAPVSELRCTVSELGCTISELRCTLSELHCNLTELRCTVSELRCTLSDLLCVVSELKNDAHPLYELRCTLCRKIIANLAVRVGAKLLAIVCSPISEENTAPIR
jgi:hypothetical protein